MCANATASREGVLVERGVRSIGARYSPPRLVRIVAIRTLSATAVQQTCEIEFRRYFGAGRVRACGETRKVGSFDPTSLVFLHPDANGSSEIRASMRYDGAAQFDKRTNVTAFRTRKPSDPRLRIRVRVLCH